MKLATTTSYFYSTTKTQAEAVAAFEGTGFRHLDYNFYTFGRPNLPFMGDGDWMKDVRDAKAVADKLGFDFVQAHSPSNNPFDGDWDFTVKAHARSIEAAGYLGVKNIVVHSGFSQQYQYTADRDAFFESNKRFYDALVPTMEKTGVTVCIENTATGNMGSMYFFRKGEEMRDFVDYFNHPLLKCCWDVGHANMEDPDQYKDIIAMGDTLATVHIQDNLGQRDDHMAPFMGTLDVNAVMRGLIDGGFVSRGGVFTFEADNLLSAGGSWPNCRNDAFADKNPITGPSLALRRKATGLLYEIGKEILEGYGLYED